MYSRKENNRIQASDQFTQIEHLFKYYDTQLRKYKLIKFIKIK